MAESTAEEKKEEDVNRPLIDGLKQLSEEIREDANNRVSYLKVRTHYVKEAEKQGRKLSDEEERKVSMITPSPGF